MKRCFFYKFTANFAFYGLVRRIDDKLLRINNLNIVVR